MPATCSLCARPQGDKRGDCAYAGSRGCKTAQGKQQLRALRQQLGPTQAEVPQALRTSPTTTPAVQHVWTHIPGYDRQVLPHSSVPERRQLRNKVYACRCGAFAEEHHRSGKRRISTTQRLALTWQNGTCGPPP